MSEARHGRRHLPLGEKWQLHLAPRASSSRADRTQRSGGVYEVEGDSVTQTAHAANAIAVRANAGRGLRRVVAGGGVYGPGLLIRFGERFLPSR